MKGRVDTNGRALIRMEVQSGLRQQATPIDVWIDTGFTGDLVLPRQQIDDLGLQQSGSVDATLADGSQRQLKTFTCYVDWFGRSHPLEVIENDGDFPLLGVGLLIGLELRVNYSTLDLDLTLG